MTISEKDSSSPPTHKILLVGSVGLKHAEDVFRSLATTFGTAAQRYPDGETGARGNWVQWQQCVIEEHARFYAMDTMSEFFDADKKVKRCLFKLRPGARAEQIEFGPLGYASHAIDSYRLFARLKQDGTIPPSTRFQVSLPTPVAFLTNFVALEHRAAVEPIYRRAMKGEIKSMLDAIPLDELAIQWDVCYEVVGYDGGCELFYNDILENSLARIAQLSGYVPEPVELGFHLCYGDAGHRHTIEPKDTTTLVAFANGICTRAPRSVNWIHVPIPRERDDDEFYVPLLKLELCDETELFLGLVHYSDGATGTGKRLSAAKRYVAEFGVAAECGFGRRDPATIPELLRIHLTGQGISPPLHGLYV